MAATLKRLLTLAADANVEVEVTRGPYPSVELWSPIGQRFAATGCHCAVHAHAGSGFPISELYEGAIDDLRCGLERCDTVDCDTCSETA